LQPYVSKNAKASIYRYPSPGNSINEKEVFDYKTPYEHSKYNVRYSKPIPSQTQEPLILTVAGDGPVMTPLLKFKMIYLD
jgi:hypothetical protein